MIGGAFPVPPFPLWLMFVLVRRGTGSYHKRETSQHSWILLLTCCGRQQEADLDPSPDTDAAQPTGCLYSPRGTGFCHRLDCTGPNSLRPITFPVRSTYNQVTDRVSLEMDRSACGILAAVGTKTALLFYTIGRTLYCSCSGDRHQTKYTYTRDGQVPVTP